MTDPNDGLYEVVWPRAPRETRTRPLAPRLDTLNGRIIVQLWDRAYRGDEIFVWLEHGLKARFPDARFVSWKALGSTHGGDEAAVVAGLGSRLKALGADAAISAMGG